MPPRRSTWCYVPKPQSELVGWPKAKIAELRAHEQIVMDGEAKLLRMVSGWVRYAAHPVSSVSRAAPPISGDNLDSVESF